MVELGLEVSERTRNSGAILRNSAQLSEAPLVPPQVSERTLDLVVETYARAQFVLGLALGSLAEEHLALLRTCV